MSKLLLLLLLQEIKITGATIFTNPFQEMEEEEKQKKEAAAKQVGCRRHSRKEGGPL